MPIPRQLILPRPQITNLQIRRDPLVRAQIPHIPPRDLEPDARHGDLDRRLRDRRRLDVQPLAPRRVLHGLADRPVAVQRKRAARAAGDQARDERVDVRPRVLLRDRPARAAAAAVVPGLARAGAQHAERAPEGAAFPDPVPF